MKPNIVSIVPERGNFRVMFDQDVILHNIAPMRKGQTGIVQAHEAPDELAVIKLINGLIATGKIKSVETAEELSWLDCQTNKS